MYILVKQSLALACVLTPVLALPCSSPSICHSVCSANKTQLSSRVACRENSPVDSQLDKCLECLQANPSETGGTESRWYSSALRNAITTCLYSHPEPQSNSLPVSSCATDKPCLQHVVFSRSQDTSSDFSPGAIAGAIVALLLLFMAAVGLFLIYFQQQRRFRKTYQSQFASPQPKSLSVSLSPHEPVCHTQRSRSASSESIDCRTPAVSSDMAQENLTRAFDPRSTNRGPNASLPTHQAYVPHLIFQGKQTDPLAGRQKPSAPSSSHPPRTGSPDSFIIQTYLDASGHSTRMVPVQDGPHNASLAYSSPLSPPLPAAYHAATRPKERKKLALQIPPLPNLKIPKIHSPLRCRPGQSKREMQISRPIMQTHVGPDAQSLSDASEHPKVNSPSGGNTWNQPKAADELPIRSPKSILYG
ncbi:hypothetical protein CDD82_7473 [Ophiocordyceps australis]|uniref:Extracellular membrane protein CFEM domain-containing protein n=1 Tax=Ophiocordyceps australis TaxID=1399860 RepID=A0A2C5XVF0_9HYPO|nr:hypothetical protein CDD82_7473 [Ophiocordyceps australis]